MLKQLLQLLLNTRTTPEEAAHSAMPSDKYTRLVDNGTIGSEWTAQAFSGIAAYDGYLFFAGTSTSAVPIVGIATAGCASNLTFPWEGARLATTIPIAKGQTWTVQGSSLKDVIIDLSKTVAVSGEGYNLFVWRALSCLKPSFSYSPKVSSRANTLALLIKSEEKALHKQRLQSLILPSGFTPLLTQGMSHSEWHLLKTLGLGLITKQAEPATLLMQQERGKRRQSLSRKGTLLSSLYPKAPILPKRHVGSYHACVNLNLRQGGALC